MEGDVTESTGEEKGRKELVKDEERGSKKGVRCAVLC